MKQPSLPPMARAEWVYFLDVDGTLIDIADTPGDVVVDDGLLDLISLLSATTALALISGRSLADLMERFTLPHRQLPMAAQHGLERINAQGKVFAYAPSAQVKALVQERLANALQRHPALLFEDKGIVMALHYRRVPHLGALVRRLMKKISTEIGDSYELLAGKCVVEIKPAGINKGTAIDAFMQEPEFAGATPVFIGDDNSDEAGFAAVNVLGGVSIKVGSGHSLAHHRLDSVEEVRAWLSSALPVQLKLAG